MTNYAKWLTHNGLSSFPINNAYGDKKGKHSNRLMSSEIQELLKVGPRVKYTSFNV